ncbi:MAG: response regulator, partial [Longimicrobiales bacterium]
MPLRVLAVEDSEDDYELIMRELRGKGFDVTGARVESELALHGALELDGWEVVLSDYSLPGFDGLHALGIVQQHDIDLPVIVISGTIGEEAAVAALKSGAEDFMAKANLARLAPAVERALRTAALRRERRRAEEALRTSEIRFRALIEQGSDLIAVVGETGVAHYLSPSFQPFVDALPPGGQAGFPAQLDAASAGLLARALAAASEA